MTPHARLGVSIIMCARDEERTIARQLDALGRQQVDVPWEVVLVDNGSRDTTAQIAERYVEGLGLRIVQCHQPGLAGARNVGVRSAAFDLLVHCDADDEVGDGWLQAMVDGLATHPIVTGSLEEGSLNRHNPFGRVQRSVEHAAVSNGFLPFAVGANMGYRRCVHQAIEGWDEDFRLAADDVDFSWRAQLAGFELGFLPTAVVHYRHRTSARALLRQFAGYGVGDVALYKRFAARGMRRDPARTVIRRWAWVLQSIPAAARPGDRRVAFLATLGFGVGRLWGSITHRRLYL